jgi:hypothetical protein
VNFNLDRSAKKQCLIYAVVYFGGKQYKVSTGVKVHPSHWNAKKQVATVSNGLTALDNHNNGVVNAKLRDVLAKFEEAKRYLCNNPEEIGDFYSVLKRKLNPEMKGRIMKRGNKLIATIQLEQLVYKMCDNGDITEGTYNQYRSPIKYFKSFFDDKKNGENNFGIINHKLIKEFQTYLNTDVIYRGKKLSTNAINKNVWIIEYLLELFSENNTIGFKFTKADNVKSLKTKVKKEDKKKKQVALNIKQLETLYSLELTGEDEEARDIFICMCLVGLRISDVPKLFCNMYDIIDDNFVEVSIQKTKRTGEQTAIIPLFPFTKQILDKYKNGFQHIKINTFTDYPKLQLDEAIKRICKKAVFDKNITYR